MTDSAEKTVQYLLAPDNWDENVCRAGWRNDGLPIELPRHFADTLSVTGKQPRATHEIEDEDETVEATSHRIAAPLLEVVEWLSDKGIFDTLVTDLFEQPYACTVDLDPRQEFEFRTRWF